MPASKRPGNPPQRKASRNARKASVVRKNKAAKSAKKKVAADKLAPTGVGRVTNRLFQKLVRQKHK